MKKDLTKNTIQNYFKDRLVVRFIVLNITIALGILLIYGNSYIAETVDAYLSFILFIAVPLIATFNIFPQMQEVIPVGQYSTFQKISYYYQFVFFIVVFISVFYKLFVDWYNNILFVIYIIFHCIYAIIFIVNYVKYRTYQ